MRKKLLSLVTVMLFLLSTSIMPVFASESSEPDVLDANDVALCENFEVMTRTEYISELAESKGISYQMAEDMARRHCSR